MINDDTVKY